MSLMFTQLYVKNSSVKNVFSALSEINPNKLEQISYLEKEELSKLSVDEMKNLLWGDVSYFYRQSGVVVIQLESRHNKVPLKTDLKVLSERLSSTVVLCDYYEGYYANISAYDNGKLILEVYQSEESPEEGTFETEDPRFISIKDAIQQLLENFDDETIDKLYDEGYMFASNPETLFKPLEIEFNDLYNPEPERLDEVLTFKVL